MAGESPAARYSAEFVGTFALVFTVYCCVITKQATWGGLAIGSVLMVMIYALGKASGAHFNPAVSLAVHLSSQSPDWKEFAIYSVVQILGGLAASLVSYAVFFQTITLQPVGDNAWWQAGAAEMLYTFMLCFVVLNVACSKAHAGKNQFYGLAIGFVIVAGADGSGRISMGCFNPAVAAGLAVPSLSFKYMFLYFLFEVVGACLAAGLFRVCRPEEFGEVPVDPHTSAPIYPLYSKLVSEFVGTYMLVLTVGLDVLAHGQASVLSIASALMCMIYALGSASGAHFNPAVTVAILCSGRGKITAADAGAYCGVQILAGLLASVTYASTNNGLTFAVGPQPGFSMSQAVVAEFMFTFVLAFVVLSVATVKNVLSEFFGLAIGFCVTVGGFAVGRISGACLNPAVAIGIDVSSLVGGTATLMGVSLIYAVAEIAAGAAAAAAFHVTQPSEYEEKDRAGFHNYGATA